MSDEGQKQQKSVPETPEELVSFARNYFSHEFPNSGHGCPSPAATVEQIESGKLPDDALRKHLLACSSCFVAYGQRLQRSRDLQPVVTPWRRRIFELLRNPWLRVLVPSLPVLLLVLAAVFYFRPKNPQEQVVLNSPAEVVNANTNQSVNAVTVPTPAPVQTGPATRTEIAAQVAQVDLSRYSPRRGNEPGEEPPALQIEQTPTAFAITLPEDSPAGTYTVFILDAFGKTINSRTSHSRDGKMLTATLNLNKLRNGTYRLCVSRSDEPPNCYPIVITTRGK